MIRIPIRRPRPTAPASPALTSADPIELLACLRTQLDAAFDPRSFPADPAPVTPREARAELLRAMEQTLQSSRTVTALIDRAKAGATPDRTISAVCDAAAALQDALHPLITAVTSTCPHSEDEL
jgi:hypothetical protein